MSLKKKSFGGVVRNFRFQFIYFFGGKIISQHPSPFIFFLIFFNFPFEFLYLSCRFSLNSLSFSLFFLPIPFIMLLISFNFPFVLFYFPFISFIFPFRFFWFRLNSQKNMSDKSGRFFIKFLIKNLAGRPSWGPLHFWRIGLWINFRFEGVVRSCCFQFIYFSAGDFFV